MRQVLMDDLPSEIVMDILSRLPVRTVLACKCVCKSWFDLLETDEFVKFHIAKAVPQYLAMNNPLSCEIYEFEEDELSGNTIVEFYCICYSLFFNDYGMIQGSTNGLLLLCNQTLDSTRSDVIYVFNSVTFEYMEISGKEFAYRDNQVVTYGFGSSRVTGQLKVVRLFHECRRDQETDELLSIYNSECRVYTLGTGLWRSSTTTHGDHHILEYDPCSYGAFFFGNLHWLVFNLDGYPWISCFDVEDEVLSIFSSPPDLYGHDRMLLGLYALGDCLCLSDGMSYYDDVFVIWLMKDYGVGKSWTKEFIICKTQIPNFESELLFVALPIKLCKNGDVLMAWGGLSFFYYSSRTKTTREIDFFYLDYSTEVILHTSILLSLKKFVNENVSSL